MLAMPPVLRTSLALAVLALAFTASAAPDPAAPAYDTVLLANGGRARGVVIEDDPAAGVTLQLPDGSFRRYSRDEISRVEFAEQGAALGAQSPPPTAAPPPSYLPQPPANATPPQAYPPPPEWLPAPSVASTPASAPIRVPEPGEPLPLTLSVGLGGAYTAGTVGGRLGTTSRWWPGFMLFQAEVGGRVTPATTLLLYLDGGGGDVSNQGRRFCKSSGLDCAAGSVRFGLALRRAFAPTLGRTTWLSAGTGIESTGLMIDGPGGRQFISFDGWEALKLGAGIDFRPSRWIGFGLFSGLSLATYSKVAIDGPTYVDPGPLGGRTLHVWFQVGGRLILFP
jgi:hypothetical protein